MEDLDEPIFSEETLRRRRFLKYAGLGFGATAVTFPVIYFAWRSRSSIGLRVSQRLMGSKPPPPRRIALSELNRGNVVGAQAIGKTPALESNGSGGLVVNYISGNGIKSYLPTRADITTTTAWLAFKAFAIATAGVFTVAGAGLTLFIWSWDISSISDFKVKMRYAISSVLPTISSQVHRPLKPSETGIQNPEERSRLLEGISEKMIDTWTWDTAKERLETAYKKGGTEGWVAAAAREMEIENQQEIRRRKQHPSVQS